MIQTSEIVIKKLHRKGWRAYFQWWDERNPDLKIDTEYDAPTEERLQFKLKHLKETGVFLRD